MRRSLSLVVVAGCAFALGACASAQRAPETDPEDVALILSTDGYELHYRAGRVVLVDERPGHELGPRDVETYEEFKRLYEVKKAERLPPELPSRGVEVNGWRGLDCVRQGDTCGPAPEYPTGGLVRLRLHFPQPAR
jgi:hypothetical protein